MWRSFLRGVGLQVFPTKLGWLLNHFPISEGNCRQDSAVNTCYYIISKSGESDMFFWYINCSVFMASKFIPEVELLCSLELCWNDC